MPMGQIGRRTECSARSRLGQSLLRLHRNLHNQRQRDLQNETLFTEWQASWANRRKDITRRLEMIEAQLRLESLSDDASPQLGIFDAGN